MPIIVVSRRTFKRYRKYCKVYPSRRAAFRAAKRDGGIPVCQQPDEVICAGTDIGYDFGLDHRNVRLYVFNMIVGAVAFEYRIREDKEAFYQDKQDSGHQLPHFNSGQQERPEPKQKLRQHHYYKKKERK